MDQETKNKIYGEICEALGTIMDDYASALQTVQPTESVLELAARAAMDVIISFQLGKKWSEQ
jgi:hypothetical protein